MPTNRLRKPRYRAPDVPESFIEFLKTGCRPSTDQDFWIGAEYFDVPSTAEHWRALRTSILNEWIKQFPGTRPWAWWKFDAPEPRNPDETEGEYLKRHGLLRSKEGRA